MSVLKNAVAFTKTAGLAISLLLIQVACFGQDKIIVNLAMLDGIELTPDNIFNYQVINNSGSSQEVQLKGTVKYRNSALRFSYTATTILLAGSNQLSKEKVNPTWNFSEQGLKELFFDYKKLPQGTYEYCIEVVLKNMGGDANGIMPASDCIYQKVDDIFLINLIEPENDAKLYEFYPMFNWVVNYPFASQLTYRIRVAELKPGQSNENAITRNNPVYQDNKVFSTTQVYPLTATPLKTWQPYVWTVDAYYKGILLGGAEVWKFTIVEDSLNTSIPDQSSYVDVNMDNGSNRYYAVGAVKFKYAENDFLQNELKVSLLKGGKTKQIASWNVVRGVNLNSYDLAGFNLRHKEEFDVIIEYKSSKSGLNKQTIKYKYANPDFVK